MSAILVTGGAGYIGSHAAKALRRSGHADLGWAPRFGGLDAIVETAWRWHKAHPDGYGRAAG